MVDFEEIIKIRRSIRKYGEQDVSNEDILKIPFQQNYDIESILERYIAFTITGAVQINIEIIN